MQTKRKLLSAVLKPASFLNETASGAASTLTAILGRESAETGKEMNWEDMVHSSQQIDPKLNLAQFDKA